MEDSFPDERLAFNELAIVASEPDAESRRFCASSKEPSSSLRIDETIVVNHILAHRARSSEACRRDKTRSPLLSLFVPSALLQQIDEAGCTGSTSQTASGGVRGSVSLPKESQRQHFLLTLLLVSRPRPMKTLQQKLVCSSVANAVFPSHCSHTWKYSQTPQRETSCNAWHSFPWLFEKH